MLCDDTINQKMGKCRRICLQCGEATVGPIMTAGTGIFHPECFKCRSCQQCIGDDEQYVLVELSTLYCESCRVEKRFLISENDHVIKLVKLKPKSEDSKLYKLRRDWAETLDYKDPSTLCVSRVNSTGAESKLSVGDRILEIDGASVRDYALSDIENIINCPSKAVQVTIEQNPPCKKSSRWLDDTRPGSLSSLDLRSCELWNSVSDIEMSSEAVSTKRKVDHRPRMSRRSRGSEERAASLSRLSDCSPTPPGLCKIGLARTLSFKEHARSQCTFRACDLVKGEMLGKGFFGQVYKVTHSKTKEVMVLKELYRLDEEAQKNFLKEVAVLRRLEHPNVLRFIGVLYKERKLHLITEYVRGGSLRECIQNTQRILSWAQRTKLAHDISCGMAYLHSMGVIHRDLSSYNCLVREDMSCVVADFGLARITSEIYTQDRVRASGKEGRRIERKKRYTVVGCPWYMAPEMINRNKYDEKVDIYSFGIIICELIGRIHADPDFLPRSGDFSLNQKSFLEKFCKDCPEPLYQVAFMCCDLTPDRRPPFDSLVGWLNSLLSSLNRSLPFPGDILSEMKGYQKLGCSFDECGSGSSYVSMTTGSSGYSSGTTADSINSFSSGNNLSHNDGSVSSSCSSLSCYSKPGRLHSICEVDHSGNNNSCNGSDKSSPELDKSILNPKPMNGRALSASPL